MTGPFDAELDALSHLDPADPDTNARDGRRGEIHARMRERVRERPSGLSAWVASLDPHDPGTTQRLLDVYEALAPDAAELEDFFLVELERLLAACESRSDSEPAFDAAGGLMFLESHATQRLRTEFRRRLVAGLRSPAASVRRACADLLGGHEPGQDATARAALEAALRDPDWRVRALAESSLSGQGLLPEGYAVPFLDRMRRKAMDWTAYV